MTSGNRIDFNEPIPEMITSLKSEHAKFEFDLAKGDLTYYYKQCIDGMDEIRREAWSLYKYGDWSQGVHLTVKEKIAALRLLKECNEAKFSLLEKGPSVLNVKGMGEELENIQAKNKLGVPMTLIYSQHQSL